MPGDYLAAVAEGSLCRDICLVSLQNQRLRILRFPVEGLLSAAWSS